MYQFSFSVLPKGAPQVVGIESGLPKIGSYFTHTRKERIFPWPAAGILKQKHTSARDNSRPNTYMHNACHGKNVATHTDDLWNFPEDTKRVFQEQKITLLHRCIPTQIIPRDRLESDTCRIRSTLGVVNNEEVATRGDLLFRTRGPVW
jgi:hypothetical protein